MFSSETELNSFEGDNVVYYRLQRPQKFIVNNVAEASPNVFYFCQTDLPRVLIDQSRHVNDMILCFEVAM